MAIETMSPTRKRKIKRRRGLSILFICILLLLSFSSLAVVKLKKRLHKVAFKEDIRNKWIRLESGIKGSTPGDGDLEKTDRNRSTNASLKYLWGHDREKLRVRVQNECGDGKLLPFCKIHPAWKGHTDLLPKTWRTNSQLLYNSTAFDPSCYGLVPAAEMKGHAPNYTRPIRNVDDIIQAAREGQKLLVIAPRFGLGNSLRAFISAWTFALLTNRRIVILSAGLHHGVYVSFCQAFRCHFDHVLPNPPNGPWKRNSGALEKPTNSSSKIVSPSQLWAEFFDRVRFANVESLGFGKSPKHLWNDEPVAFTHNYAMWDSFYKGDQKLSKCVRSACGCRTFRCVHSRAINDLVGNGPSDELGITINEILKYVESSKEEGAGIDFHTKETEEKLWSQSHGVMKLGQNIRFDLGIHIRTRTATLENPTKCKAQKKLCAKDSYLMKRTEKEFLNPDLWCCIGTYLEEVRANLIGEKKLSLLKSNSTRLQSVLEKSPPLSIFLAIDSREIRDEIVKNLRPFGNVFFNSGEIAHLAVSGSSKQGRLATMAEFFLLSKCGITVEISHQLSTFSQISSLLGNGTLVGIHTTPEKCWRLGAFIQQS